MARLYSDENFDLYVVEALRQLGHDVLTARDASRAGKGIPDASQLTYATNSGRAIITFNRRHFIKLHKRTAQHKGIIVCTFDDDTAALTQRIHRAILAEIPLDNKLIRVNKPPRP